MPMDLFRKMGNKIKYYLNPRLYLWLVFRFEKWHIAPFTGKEYCRVIVSELNKKSARNTVVDLGCGLGDIVSRLRYKNKLGIDIDCNVINAANFLNNFSGKNGESSRYICQNIFEAELEGMYDVVVIVNWIHNIPPSELKALFRQLFTNNLAADGYLVFDVIDNTNYKYNHDIGFLASELSKDYTIYEPFEYGRRIVFLKKETAV
jgi:SAM-dependent methyltransferase